MNIATHLHALASSKPTQLRISETQNSITIDNIHQEKNKRETFIFDKVTTDVVKCINIESPCMCYRDNYRWMTISISEAVSLEEMFHYATVNFIECEDIVIITDTNNSNNIIAECEILQCCRMCSLATPCYTNRNRTLSLKPNDIRRPMYIA